MVYSHVNIIKIFCETQHKQLEGTLKLVKCSEAINYQAKKMGKQHLHLILETQVFQHQSKQGNC